MNLTCSSLFRLLRRSSLVAVAAAHALACNEAAFVSSVGDADAGATYGADLDESVEEGEWLPGGQTTNTLVGGDLAFTFPAENLGSAERGAFFSGDAFFNQSWVAAPSSNAARDGLGPTFNARSCSGCHFKDGRGEPPAPGEPLEGLLFRLSAVDPDTGQLSPDPIYGDQLQPFGIEGVAGEADVALTYTEKWVDYDDGEGISLRVPDYQLKNWGYGDPASRLLISPRVAPQMIGLGLLEAIPTAQLEALADPEDRDGDGIRGRVQQTLDRRTGELVAGRFGWKAEQPTVEQQVAGAFLGDMGITTELFPDENCSEVQVACEAAPRGGEPDASSTVFERVAYYARVLAPPARLDWSSDAVLRGKALFGELGCAGCHVPSFTTGESDVPALADQLIWPYTDLLLHDLGAGLADERPSLEASGSDFRTPPLWGIGRIVEVNGHNTLLHDGRARGVEEAIVWHGGEAKASQRAFRALSAAERQALIQFVESL